MPQKMVVKSIQRLTFVRKGRAMAKHPDTRDSVVEVVKAVEAEVSPWYQDFDEWLATQDELGDDPLSDFAEATKESAKKNYPDSEGPFAGPHNSFPIRSASDVIHAAQRLHNAKGNKASIKAKIRAIARAHGYPLPKTWGESTEKSVSKTKTLELVNQLLAVLKAEEAEGDPESDPAVETPAAEAAPEIPAAPAEETPAPPADAPAAPEAPAAEETPAAPESAPEAVDKAMAGHSHDHAHLSTYGYQYSHTHQHGDASHADAKDHDTSEVAHAHVHVSKATGDPEMDGLIADRDGLKAELDALKEKLSALETAKEAAEKTAARKPLVAPTAGGTPVQKSTPQINSSMKFDDAFDALLGRSN